MFGTLTGTDASFSNSITAPNGFIGTLTADRAFRQSDAEFIDDEFITKSYVDSGYVKKSGDTMFGTLTGTDASFSNSITAPNGFIGTLTGTNIRYTNAEFGAESLVIQGSSATFTDMSVMITGDYSFDVGVMSIGQTSNHTPQNPNVPRIQSQSGVLIGGNNLSKQSWIGNNVYLSPQDYVFIGIPNNTPTSWFSADGGTYPFDLKSLNVTGGIHADRAYRWGHKKGQNTFLDHEFITKDYVNKGHGTNFTIIPWGDSNIQISFIKLTVDTPSNWIPLLLGGFSSFQFKSQPQEFIIPNYGSYGNVVSISSYVRYSGYSTLAHQFFNDTQKTANINVIDTDGKAHYVVTIQTNANPNNTELGFPPNMEVYFTIISKPSQ